MLLHRILTFIIILLFLTLINCQKSKTIYSYLDLSKTSGKFDIFSIDFKSSDTPENTFWCLCQWQMDLTKLKNTYNNVSGGIAYGGLQSTKIGKTARMSLLDINYKENEEEKKIIPNKVYPKGAEEVENVDYIEEFDWEANVWYRFLIRSWKDHLTRKTFVGEWIQNLSSGKWTLFAYYNTNLIDSYITGKLNQFQEDFSTEFLGLERNFQIKNIYAYDKVYRKWISLEKSKLFYDPSSWGNNTIGTHDIGYAKYYFYGSSGLPVEDQKEYDESNPESIIGTITQASTPNFLEPQFKSLNAILTENKITINWEVDLKTCPCYEYTIYIYKYSSTEYEFIYSYVISRPEENSYSFSSPFKGNYLVNIECKGISNFLISESVYKHI